MIFKMTDDTHVGAAAHGDLAEPVWRRIAADKSSSFRTVADGPLRWPGRLVLHQAVLGAIAFDEGSTPSSTTRMGDPRI